MNFGATATGVVADVDGMVVLLSALGLDAPPGLFDQPALNAFMAAGPDVWASVSEQLGAVDPERGRVAPDDAELLLPFAVADYVDFYASIHHATRVGGLFRPDTPLMPNYRHLPVGYHGRSGTVVVSGTPVTRPCGQRGPDDVGPTRKLDFELELGFVVGTPSELFGVVLLNDWSARDIQQWEGQPLGPFLGKSFATSISAWVTPLADLLDRRVPPPDQAPPPPAYLRPAGDGHWALDLPLTVEVNGSVVASSNASHLYWTPAQLAAHLTSNGTVLRTGDLLGSGTVSGPDAGQEGCLLETGRGQFLADGDSVVLRAPGTPLADCAGVVRPAAGPLASG